MKRDPTTGAPDFYAFARDYLHTYLPTVARRSPKTIEAFGPEPHPEIAPASMRAVYEYGPRGDMPACKLTWHQGTEKPEIWKEKGIPQYQNGVLFIGTNGRMLIADYEKHTLLPEAEFKDFVRPPQTIPALRSAPSA